MKKFKKWLKKNKNNMLLSIGGALAIKLMIDASRFYSAFGGEELILISAICYWIWRWFEDKNYIKEKAPNC